MAKRVRIAIVVVVVLAAGAAWLLLRGAASGPNIEASGTIEAEEVAIAAEIGGRLAQVLVEEGDAVRAGQALARIDDTLAAAQLRQADAAVAVARANVDRVRAGARPEDIAAAAALAEQAAAEAAGAAQALANAEALREKPQTLDAQLAAAEGRVSAAQETERQAAAQAQAAEQIKDYTDRATALLEDGTAIKVENPMGAGELIVRSTPEQIDALRLQRTLASHDWWSAQARLDAATARSAALERLLADLKERRQNPIALDAQVDVARHNEDAAAAAQSAATARLAALRAGPTAEQLAVAEARFEQAEAARALLDVQCAKLSLTAPNDGIVVERSVEPGEVVLPGAAILRVADLERLTIRLFIPEDEIGRVYIGQPVRVHVDSFPGAAFAGRIANISDQAEFTPRNVQTKKERVNTVFAVKVELPNPDLRLKPGMPADATIEVAP